MGTRREPATKTKALLLSPGEPGGLRARVNEFLEWLLVRNHTTDTVYSRAKMLGSFVIWCEERGLLRPQEITKPILERYQRWLFHYRKKNGHPLGVSTQYATIVSIRRFFSWLARENFILFNPASDLVLPRLGQRLPQAVLSHVEVERVLGAPDLKTPLGVRDRAILETLYSTGIRRRELVNLSVFDVDHGRGTVMIRLGKGQRDRVVPIGDRALAWIDKYVRDVRPQLVVEPDNGSLFLTNTGEQIPADWLSATTRRYIVEAGISKPGSCHLLRHSAATAMLEGGADVRYIQVLLGHASLRSTEIYTRVSIQKLKEIHRATHPGASLKPRVPSASVGEPSDEDIAASLLDAIVAEVDDDPEA